VIIVSTAQLESLQEAFTVSLDRPICIFNWANSCMAIKEERMPIQWLADNLLHRSTEAWRRICCARAMHPQIAVPAKKQICATLFIWPS